MMIFSERMKLAEKMEEYMEEHKIYGSTMNTITALYLNGLLDVNKVKRFLEVDKNDDK